MAVAPNDFTHVHVPIGGSVSTADEPRGSKPKRHHQVPQFYLARFATDGKVAVRRRDGKAYDTGPVNVAVESGFYDLPDGVGGVSKTIEHGLANIEGMTDQMLRNIDRVGRPPASNDHDRATLALFIGLQMVRTTSHRDRVLFPKRVVDWADDREVTKELVAEFLESQHLGFRPEEAEVDGAFTVVSVAVRDAPETLTEAFAIETMVKGAWEISRRLLPLNWSLEFDRKEEFITSDEPVVVWRKPTWRDDFEGFGIANGAELRLPLDPGKQLVISRRKRRTRLDVATHRVGRSNAEMAGACHRFIIGNPARREQLDRQTLEEWRPVVRFNVGPGFETLPDGTTRPMPGEIVHMWVPRRPRRSSGVAVPRGSRTVPRKVAVR